MAARPGGGLVRSGDGPMPPPRAAPAPCGERRFGAGVEGVAGQRGSADPGLDGREPRLIFDDVVARYDAGSARFAH
jgi:hypothetical protein